jgi:hypothetical protein
MNEQVAAWSQSSPQRRQELTALGGCEVFQDGVHDYEIIRSLAKRSVTRRNSLELQVRRRRIWPTVLKEALLERSTPGQGN